MQADDSDATQGDDEPPAKKPKGDLCIFCFGVLTPSDIEDIAMKVSH